MSSFFYNIIIGGENMEIINKIKYREQSIEITNHTNYNLFYLPEIASGSVFSTLEEAQEHVDIYLDALEILNLREKEHSIYSDSSFQINIASSTFNDKKYFVFLVIEIRSGNILIHRIFTENQGRNLAKNIYYFTCFDILGQSE